MIEFDKKAPGGGVSAECRMENGKVILEWRMVLSKIDFRGIIRLRLRDVSGNIVLECMQASDEEEPLQSVLLQPHLWTGVDNPYLYLLEAILEDREGNCLDRVVRQFPVRCVELRRTHGEDVEKLFLNGERFVPKAVMCQLPMCVEKVRPERTEDVDAEYGKDIRTDLERILSLGANCICLQGSEQLPSEVTEFCEKSGVLMVVHTLGKLTVGETCFSVDKDRTLEDYLGKIPSFPDMEEALYKARWGKLPFVHICVESLKPMKSGNYTVTCYSNSKRLALYSDGQLFEFQHGLEVFTFQEIPVKGPCIMLAVEGEGCSASLSLHRTFTKLSPNGDN